MVLFFSYLFYPITILYSIFIFCRNKLYDYEILEAKKHKVITVGVGNIRVGGTGKTPHVELLINFLSEKYNVGVLSRGYGRKTKGFILLDENDSAIKVGDEPLQMKKKFPNIPFAVCENRNKGIQKLENLYKDLDIVILDDVFQHRSLHLDFSILLTEFSNPFFKDKILPFGLLREHRNGYKRADYIIITKSPKVISIGDRTFFESRLKPKKYQKVFYSSIEYKKLYSLFEKQEIEDFSNKSVILLTSIADNTPIVKYLESKTNIIEKLEFPDHYNFADKDIENIIKTYNTKKQEDSIIITTEKDSMRLVAVEKLRESNIPIYVLPISLDLDLSRSNSPSFKQIFIDDVRQSKSYGSFH